ncbi:MAG: hypothetical protein ACXAEN_26255 [Candidatus Thorarchaeota archaeon]|jgi:hypothetical protein
MAKLNDIDKRTKVGSKAWTKKHDKETQQLSAWRRLHALLPHEDVVQLASPTDHPAKLAAIAMEVERLQKESE